MAEKMKDDEDRMLESMFQSGPIADDGFSDRVVRRIRLQLWVRRLALPIAMLIGAAIALKPATQLLAVVSKLLGVLPTDVLAAPGELAAQLPMVLGAGALLGIVVVTFRMLEE